MQIGNRKIKKKNNDDAENEIFIEYDAKKSILGHSYNENKIDTKMKMEKENEYLTTICKRLAAIIMSVSKHSTVHSLNHLSQAKSTKQKLFWLIIGCIALFGLVINLYGLITKYLQRPVLTNIFHDHTSFVYPDVTICNVNPLYLGSGNSNNNTSLFLLIDKFLRNDIIVHKNFTDSLDDVEINHEYPDISDLLFVQKSVDYSYPAWSLIIKCKYMQADCHWYQFEIRHIWPFGNCFTFNVSKMDGERTRNVKKTMIRNGWRPDFKIIIYKGLNHLNKIGLDPFNNINTPTGILVMIHEARTYPYRDEGIFVDSFTQIDLKGTTKVHININDRCNNFPTKYDYYDFKTNKCQSFYGRQADCVSNLIQKKMSSSCNCVIHTIPVPCSLRRFPFCIILLHTTKMNLGSRLNITNCIERNMNNISNYQEHKDCHKDLCEHTTFTTVVSHSSYPSVREKQNHFLWLKVLHELQRRELKYEKQSDLHLHSIQKQIVDLFKIKSIEDALKIAQNISAYKILNENFINQNFMQVRIVPSSLFMDHIEETVEYPFVRLLSDIGGCIGLWVGASLITIFELIYLFLKCFDVCYSYIKRSEISKLNNLTNNTNNIQFDVGNDVNLFLCLHDYELLERNIFQELSNEE